MPPTFAFTAREIIDQGRVPQDVFNALKQWCQSEKLPVLADEQLVLFLLSCYNELEATQKTIHAHFKCKVSAPELFFNRDFWAEDVQKAMKVCQMSIFPTRTANNEAIVFWRLQDFSYSKFNLEYIVKLVFMIGEFACYQDPPEGVVILIDLKGLGLWHLTKLRIGPLRKFFKFVQEGYSCKIRQIHIFNTVYFIDKIMVILKPLMSKELYNMIKFHPSNMKMESFFETHLPRDCIPADYEGSLPDQATLSVQTYNALQGMNKFYRDEEQQVKAYKIVQ
ncbi:retinaldehyde-binding protein 1-like [Tribolium madens]|uniref:retinaldehyde-binding protein 1-like n=1 Tax=Tribolium madens TaxID=41895 RepID=UPI001CF753F5|nr:retinaldehyde-binding protein 1-like [Tribolium madens]